MSPDGPASGASGGFQVQVLAEPTPGQGRPRGWSRGGRAGASRGFRPLSPIFLLLLASLLLLAGAAQVPPAGAQPLPGTAGPVAPACCRSGPGLAAYQVERMISYRRLAELFAPVLWFSPDEPLLPHDPVSGIRIPEPFPFDAPRPGPVVYYRVRTLLIPKGTVGNAFLEDPADRSASLIDLEVVRAIDLDYQFYYSTEEGLGSHPHDVEGVELKLEVRRHPRCPPCRYALHVLLIIAKAHGLRWFDNTLLVTDDTVLPVTLLIEEGKHASCTDRNGDGYYSPGFDVNVRSADAMGVRDIQRTGLLFTGAYDSWMTKVRRPETIVAPPLPPDSPLYPSFASDRRGLLLRTSYELLPWPTRDETVRADEKLREVIASKEPTVWPEQRVEDGMTQMDRFLKDEGFLQSISVAYRYDGRSGFSLLFPLLLVKNVEFPITGGWFVWHVYVMAFRDVGLTVLYTPSASRWVDPYLSAGAEVGSLARANPSSAAFVLEGGSKLRFNLERTPLRFLGYLGTNYWGARAGLRYVGFSEFETIGLIFEVGAGVW